MLNLPADAGVRVVPWRPGHFTTELEIDLPSGAMLRLNALGAAKCNAQPRSAAVCSDELKVWCGGDSSICETMRPITAAALTRTVVKWLDVTIMAPANAQVVEQLTLSSPPRMANPPPDSAPKRAVEITLGARTLVKLSEGQQEGALKCASEVCCTAGNDPALARQMCDSLVAE